jgi:uncharacterized alkaline shock family protein YloU
VGVTARPGALPCGADPDALLDQAAESGPEPRPGHQSGCPHCQAALAEYDRLLAPVDELAATEVRPPASITEEVLRRIRGALPDPAYGVIPGPRGVTRISGHLVGVTARVVTEQVPGVRAALAGAEGDPPRVEAGTAGLTTVVHVVLAADWGADLPALAGSVRAEVTRVVERTTGLRVVRVDVTIDDVLPPAR